MRWNNQQERALHLAGQWLQSSEQSFYLAGVAGTGKSTIARHLVSQSDRVWLFAAYTGKAAHVMRRMGCHGASTIHSLIYRPSGLSRSAEISAVRTALDEITRRMQISEDTVEDRREQRRLAQALAELSDGRRPRFSVWKGSRLGDADVAGVVVDEVSMVDDQLGRDLLSFGKRVLVLGDPEQLPPVFGGGFFTEREPNVMLTDVHRQALDSGILRLATHVRHGGTLSDFTGDEDCEIMRVGVTDKGDITMSALAADQVLVGLNGTRRAANLRHRQLIGRSTITPIPEDRLICLRNDRETGLFNGSQWSVISADCTDDHVGDLRLSSDDDEGVTVDVTSWLHHMVGRHYELTRMGPGRYEFQEFDWAYAMTVHKAQGSQWNDVVLFDQSRSIPGGNARRWLYTGITRAARRLTVIT